MYLCALCPTLAFLGLTKGCWSVVSAHVHALLTPKPEERDRITQLIAQQGDLQKGVEVWVRER